MLAGAGWLLELCWALLVEGFVGDWRALAQEIPALRLNAREIGGQSLLALAPLTPHSQESQNPRLSQPACFLLQLVCRPRTRLASHAPVNRQAGRSQSVNIKARNALMFLVTRSLFTSLQYYTTLLLPSCPPGGPRHAYSSSPSNGCTSYAVSCTKYPCALSTHASLPPHRYHY